MEGFFEEKLFLVLELGKFFPHFGNFFGNFFRIGKLPFPGRRIAFFHERQEFETVVCFPGLEESVQDVEADPPAIPLFAFVVDKSDVVSRCLVDSGQGTGDHLVGVRILGDQKPLRVFLAGELFHFYLLSFASRLS